LLITGHNGVGPISKLYKNDGTGNFTEDVGQPFDAVFGGNIAFADVDNDNDLDVLITGSKNSLYDEVTKLYKNDGNGNFTVASGSSFYAGFHTAIAFADIDNDNDQDLIITAGLESWVFDKSVTKLYKNDGTGKFSEVPFTTFVGVRAGDVAFADIDNDNDQDLIITGYDGAHGYTMLFTNDGTGYL